MRAKTTGSGAREDSRNLGRGSSRGVVARGEKEFQQPHQPQQNQELWNQRSPGRDGLDESKNGVFALLLSNFGVHIAATSFLPGLPAMLALSHLKPAWWQFITAAFVHANWDHLFGNAFSLLVFGRMVEEEEGAFGLWVTYLVCGVAGNVASYLSSPHSATVSLGASSAVFGLFAVGVLTKVRLDLRRMLEALVLGAVRALGRVAGLLCSRVVGRISSVHASIRASPGNGSFFSFFSAVRLAAGDVRDGGRPEWGDDGGRVECGALGTSGWRDRRRAVGAALVEVAQRRRRFLNPLISPEMSLVTTRFDPASCVGELILNNPTQANALTPRMLELLPGALAGLLAASARCVVVHAIGHSKHFCAGLSIDALSQSSESAGDAAGCQARRRWAFRAYIRGLQRVISRFEECEVPVIAAVHGACVGAGVDLITACDIRLCTTSAAFCVKEVDLGIVADMGTLSRLPGIVGDGIARHLSLTGETIDGARAREVCLVSEALPTEEALRSSAMEMARSIAAKSTLAVSGTKEVLLFQRDHGRVDDSLRYVASLNASILPDNEDVKSILRDARGRSGTSTQRRTQQRSTESTFSSKL